MRAGFAVLVVGIVVIAAVAMSLLAGALGMAPITVPPLEPSSDMVFNETFPQPSLNPSMWTVVSGATPSVDANAVAEPSPPYALRFSATGTVRSRPIDLSRYSSGAIVLSWERGGNFGAPEPGDDITISANLTIGPRAIGSLVGNATPTDVFQETAFPLPREAFHAGFSFDLAYVRASGEDIWFLDNIRIVVTPAPFPWSTLALGVVGGAVAIVGAYAIRHRTVVEEIFLLDRSGELIRHVTRRLRPDFDEDILGGMLSAVQSFVRDSFREEGELNEIGYGKMRILFESGGQLVLAVVLSHGSSLRVRGKMREVIVGIEDAFAKVLESWDGTPNRFQGVDLYLRGLVPGRH
jgi:hypothetical protein